MEAAIREWARSHADAARAVGEGDMRRLSFLRRKFEEVGLRHRAPASAALLYATLVGAELLSATAVLSAEKIEAFTRNLLRDDGAAEPCL